LSLAKQHVAVVERYPELQNLTQHAALTMGKELDQLPKGARDQRRAALRDEAAHHGSGHGSRGRGRSKRTPATRRLPDPNRRWFNAAQAL
jgi:hypothetical protein